LALLPGLPALAQAELPGIAVEPFGYEANRFLKEKTDGLVGLVKASLLDTERFQVVEQSNAAGYVIRGTIKQFSINTRMTRENDQRQLETTSRVLVEVKVLRGGEEVLVSQEVEETQTGSRIIRSKIIHSGDEQVGIYQAALQKAADTIAQLAVGAVSP